MNRLLHFGIRYARIRLSRKQKAAGVVALKTSGRRHLSAGDRTALLLPEASTYHPFLSLAERCFCFLFATYHINATHKTPTPASTGWGRGISKERLQMQPPILPDPSDLRVKKAQEYLHRIERYCSSPHASIYDTWIERSYRQHTVTTLTTKNINIIRAVRHAVKVLGGKCSIPRIQHGWFEHASTGDAERHTVVMIHFMY